MMKTKAATVLRKHLLLNSVVQKSVLRSGPVSALTRSAAAGLVLSMAGCSMAPSYERPVLPVAQQLAEVRGNDETVATALANTEWRDFYLDPPLQGLMEFALANNRDLRVAALNVEQVQAQYRIQRAELLPNLAANANGTRQRVPESLSQTGSGHITSQYTVGLGVAAWEMDLFGRVNSLRHGALHQYLATAQARRGVQLSLLAQVGEAYFTWAANQSLLNLSTDTVERQQASYRMVERRHRSGLASSLDLSQAASAVHSARADIARYQRQVEQSYTALELLVGAPLNPQELGGGLELDKPSIAAIPAGLDSQVLLQRPDILQAEYALQAANANIGAARAAFFPRVALTASAGTASAELDSLFANGAGAWSFSPQVSLPIFTWGANKAALDVAHLRNESSIAQYELAIQRAFKEALDGLQALETINAQLAAQEDLLNTAARSLDLAKVRYEKGVDSFLEVLVAQRTYNSAQQALVTARLAQLTNQITLFRALGGGVNTLGADLAQATSGSR